MLTQPLRGALVGAGRVSEYHLAAWGRIPRADIVAIADPDLAQARQRAQSAGLDPARAFESLEALLAGGPALDFVDITAPPETHVALVRVAAAHGLHILCQKPFAHSLAEAQMMIELARAAGVTLAVNENWRWRVWYRTIGRLIAAGTIGRPLYARIFFHSAHRLPGTSLPADHRFLRWQRVLLFDWGIHHIDVLRFLFGTLAGEPVSVYARMAQVNKTLGGEDRALVMLAWDGDLTGLLDTSMSSFDPWGVPGREDHIVEDTRFEGDQGTISLLPDPIQGDLIRVTTAEGTTTQPAYDCAPFQAYLNSYFDAQQHFIDCLLNGTTPETHAGDNYETLAITLAAYEAVARNTVVDVAAFKRQATTDRSSGDASQ